MEKKNSSQVQGRRNLKGIDEIRHYKRKRCKDSVKSNSGQELKLTGENVSPHLPRDTILTT